MGDRLPKQGPERTRVSKGLVNIREGLYAALLLLAIILAINNLGHLNGFVKRVCRRAIHVSFADFITVEMASEGGDTAGPAEWAVYYRVLDQLEVTDLFEDLNIEVIYWGEPLTEILKNQETLITI